ncbi:NAD(P)H-dependent FMN reductase [Streptomyces sp. 2323.1]|uniref:NADPH-dependent FMN reductase n=1 Tax=Streptomyces sp. 2323.1 TaxID=1938841 RepID=UPI000BB69EC1|nr:NADPH-dependent FMN reductase [Streptomyces sp. 2323.1]SOE15871.1 NAD(P)H-dependent FMN reductase [Streptomyces sp. 2323.1]
MTLVQQQPRCGKLLVLVGAATPASRSRSAAESVCAEAERAGLESRLWDLAEDPLPLLDTSRGGAGHGAGALRDRVAEADSLVLVTPCYHGSYSGVLKNCLDYLRADDLRGKPVGIAAVGASLTAVQACDHLRSVARTLGCVTAPTQTVFVHSGPGGQDSDLTRGQQDSALGRIRRMVGELRALSEATSALRGAAEADPLTAAGAGA